MDVHISSEIARSLRWINDEHRAINFDAYFKGKYAFLVVIFNDFNWLKDEISDGLSNIVEDKNNGVAIVSWTTFGHDLWMK
jgi:hypothetical protein